MEALIKQFKEYRSKDWAGIGFCILMGAMPLILDATMAFATISLIAFALGVVQYRLIKKSWKLVPANKGIYTLPVYFLAVLIGLGTSFSADPDVGRVTSQIPFLIIPLLLLYGEISEEWLARAKRAFVWSAAFFCLLAFCSLIYNLGVNYEHRLNYNFVQRSMIHFHYPYDALYINVGYALLLTDPKMNRLVNWFTPLFLVFVFLSGVRIGFFSFFLLSGIYFLLNYKRLANKWFFLKVAAVVVILAVGISSSKYTRDKFFDTLASAGLGTESYVSDIGQDYHKISLRTKLWQSSKDLWQKKWFFGHGPNASQPLLEKQYIKNGFTSLEGLNSHNQFLTSSVELGILGFLSLLAIYLFAARTVVQQRNLQSGLLLLLLILASNTESILVRQKGVFLFVVVMSLILLNAALAKKKSA